MSAAERHLRADDIERAAFSGARDAHAEDCLACARKISLARARKQLLRAIPPAELDELAFRRIEQRLFAPAQPRPAPLAWLRAPTLIPLGLAAALALGLFLLRPAEHAQQLSTTAAQESWRPLVPALATVVQGEVSFRADADADWQPLAPGELLQEGAELRSAQGRAALVLAPGTGLVLEPHSALGLATLRQARTALALASGRVACAVRPLIGDASFSVSAGTREVRVVGTAFAVARSESGVLVEVQHGLVALEDALDPAQRAEVRGPGRLEIGDADRLEPGPTALLTPQEELALALSPEWNLAAPSLPPLARLELGGLPHGSTIEVDRSGFGPEPWIGLLPLGSHHVKARQPGKAERDLWLNLGPSGSVARLDRLLAQRASRLQRSSAPLDVEDFSEAIHGHLGELRGCYERWLKRDAQAEGSIVLALEIAASGKVRSVAAKGLELPDETEACISKAAERWSLPAPGAPMTVELPLRLTHREP